MKKIIILLLGIILLAFGTSICNYTGLGIDPFNAFCIGGGRLTNIALGTFVLIAQFIIAAIVFFLDKKYIGIGTVIPMVTFGYALQFFNWLIGEFVSFEFLLFVKIIIFLFGMLIIALGMSIYMSCDLGMVPYDGLAFVISEKIGKNAFALRVVLDVSVAVLALFVKGPINIGTVILAFGVGPLLNIVNNNVVNKLLLNWEDI